jgi:hypothetical protein
MFSKLWKIEEYKFPNESEYDYVHNANALYKMN